MDAAHLASGLDGFYNITVKNLATPLSNRFFDSLEPLNDFTSTWIGIVRDDRDARELLTGNHIYVPQTFKTSNDQVCASSMVYKSNSPYDTLVTNVTNLRTNLVPVRQCVYNTQNFDSDTPVLASDPAGLLTTRSWGKAHMFAGTNRRAVEYALNVFLCRDISSLRDSEMPDWHIDRKSTRLNSSHIQKSRMPSSA